MLTSRGGAEGTAEARRVRSLHRTRFDLGSLGFSCSGYSLTHIGAEVFIICLRTCYSEGEVSLCTTLDSISTTLYSDSRELLFAVADGMITGAGEKRSMPDICVSLLKLDPHRKVDAMAYEVVGFGAKVENRAMAHAGHYSEHPVPHPFVEMCSNRSCSHCWSQDANCHRG